MGTRAPPLSGQVVGIVEIQGENVGSGWGCGKPKIDLGLKKRTESLPAGSFHGLKIYQNVFFRPGLAPNSYGPFLGRLQLAACSPGSLAGFGAASWWKVKRRKKRGEGEEYTGLHAPGCKRNYTRNLHIKQVIMRKICML